MSIQPCDLPVETLGAGQLLSRDGGHQVWWCEGGDPQGLPVLIVHGGPGGRSRGEPLQWWAGQPIRWICMDQRGSGRSLPRGQCSANTLAHLVEDIEFLRSQLGLSRWAVAAGSWGAFVALAYAAAHPQAVSGLFLRSAFLGSREELAHYLAPWPAWFSTAPVQQRVDVPDPGQLYRLLTPTSQPDTAFSLSDAFLALGPWMQAFEALQSAAGGIAGMAVNRPAAPSRWSEDDAADWRVHSHYASGLWTTGEDGWAHAVRALCEVEGPVSLVHGVEDAVCPVQTSQRLAALRPAARLLCVQGGGHRMGVDPMRAALAAAAGRWVEDLRSL